MPNPATAGTAIAPRWLPALAESSTWSVTPLESAGERESPPHPVRVQAARRIKVVVFISDSVEVSMETPAESGVAQLRL